MTLPTIFPLEFWSESAKLIISFYSLSIVAELAVLVVTAYSWAILPSRFKVLAAAGVSLILVGFTICYYYLISLNTQWECTVGRKFAYSFFYLGFFIYDIYQLQKVVAITNPGKIGMFALHTLLLLRFISYAFNVATVNGALTFGKAYMDGRAACTSSFMPEAIYQEHLVSIAFEFALMAQFSFYVLANKARDIPLSHFLKQVVDFESISFLFYLAIEIFYTTSYVIMPRTYISLLNTFYLNVPVVLFFFNIWYFCINVSIFLRIFLRMKNNAEQHRASISGLGRKPLNWSQIISNSAQGNSFSTPQKCASRNV
jgi:hypothetical protein